MSELDHLAAEIVAHPDDDAPRLVWADAIGGERGELVALQCARETATREQLIAINRRERELLTAQASAWAGLEGIARRVQFHRGFVDAIEIDVDTLLARADDVARIAPRTSQTVGGERVEHVALVDGLLFSLGRVRLRAYVGPGAGARATACALAIDTIDPLTGLPRATPADAQLVHVANAAQLAQRHGSIVVDAALRLLVRRLRTVLGEHVLLSTPRYGVIGIVPKDAILDLELTQGFVVDEQTIVLQLEGI